MSEDANSGCFRVFCTAEKKILGEGIKQKADEEATEAVLRTRYENKRP